MSMPHASIQTATQLEPPHPGNGKPWTRSSRCESLEYGYLFFCSLILVGERRALLKTLVDFPNSCSLKIQPNSNQECFCLLEPPGEKNSSDRFIQSLSQHGKLKHPSPAIRDIKFQGGSPQHKQIPQFTFFGRSILPPMWKVILSHKKGPRSLGYALGNVCEKCDLYTAGFPCQPYSRLPEQVAVFNRVWVTFCFFAHRSSLLPLSGRQFPGCFTICFHLLKTPGKIFPIVIDSLYNQKEKLNIFLNKWKSNGAAETKRLAESAGHHCGPGRRHLLTWIGQVEQQSRPDK